MHYGKVQFLFFRSFSLASTKFSFWEDDRALGYNFMNFWDFLTCLVSLRCFCAMICVTLFIMYGWIWNILRTFATENCLICQRFAKLFKLTSYYSLREKCLYSEFFRSVFSCIQTEYGEMRIRQNTRKYKPEKLRMRTLFTQCSK